VAPEGARSYVLAALQDEPEALAILGRELGSLRINENSSWPTAPGAHPGDRNTPGSLYKSLTARAGSRAISYAMFAHSSEPIPGMDETLEIQRLEFDCRTDDEWRRRWRRASRSRPTCAMRRRAPCARSTATSTWRSWIRSWPSSGSTTRLRRVAPPRRVAQALRLLQLARRAGGLYLDVEPMRGRIARDAGLVRRGTPPHRRFLAQVMEVLNRLDLGVPGLRARRGHRRAILRPPHFYVRPRKGGQLEPGSALHAQLERELFHTEILAVGSPEYRELVTTGLMSGEDASLVRTLVAFCHTNLAHARPDRFDWEEVRNAFQANPEMVTSW